MTDPCDIDRSPCLRPVTWINSASDISDALLIQAQWDGGMRFHREVKVAGAGGDPTALLPPGAELRLDQRELDGERRILAAWPGLLAEVTVRRRVTYLTVVGAELAAVEELTERLSSAARATAEEAADCVRMHFWALQDGSGEMSTRRVVAPSWDEIVRNYATGTAASLRGLMAATDVPGRAGRLVLWHGAPGTGKTTAVRALSREWSGWCRPHYVMDPEKLFAEPHYLLELAGANVDDERWRLVIAEDCDEYLRSDAKLRAGASLGRLLNLCDGILGHGLKVLVLLTTNEEVGRLHPAVTRPGRCLAQVEFEPLSPTEARSWLAGAAAAPERPVTLAELYAIRERRLESTRAGQETGGYL